MSAKEINLELLLGKQGLGLNGKVVGHLEEVRAELCEGECIVEEYHVGSFAFLERLAAYSIGREILRLFGASSRGGGVKVPWDKMDLSDTEHPRLLCSVDELERLHLEER